MRPISIEQINTLIKPKQNFRDCYLVSSLSALARCENGRKILQNNVLTDGNAYCIKFNNVNGLPEQYLVKQKECDELILTNKYLEPIPLAVPHNPIIKAFEVAMNKIIRQHFFKKPLISRTIDTIEAFEYNKPSNFLEMFTGIKPITINESSISNTMQFKKNQVTNLLDMIAQEKHPAFIIGTGMKFLSIKLSDWHCYNIDSINKYNRSVLIIDNKIQNNLRINYKEAATKFKFICGYFNDMLNL